MSQKDIKQQLPKTEKYFYKLWEEEKLFSANPSSSKKSFSLLVPPPNLTGGLHIGHAMQHSILDAVARFKRLQGFDVLLQPGVDHAGIAFETTFNKQLKKENQSKEKLGRENWLKLAQQFKEKIYKEVSSDWRMMGLSADWQKEVFSLDTTRQKAVYEQFNTYFKKGFIYKGPYIVQWCPKCKTAIEDVEIEYEEREEKLYFVRYELSAPRKDDYVTVATARPETIFADVAIAIHPKDYKHKKLIEHNGKLRKALNPLTRSELEIITDNRVDMKFGTGALKITPGHDKLDYDIGKDHDIRETLQVIGKDGRMTGNVKISVWGEKKFRDDLVGLKTYEARSKVVDILRETKALEKVIDYKHSVPVCERCKSIVETLISEEWFLKVDDLATGAVKLIKDNRIKFLPTNYRNILVNWLENIHDWCISRSLWWGHRIPVWYLPAGKQVNEAQMKVSLKSPGPDWKQDKQVLDTWFSSGLWPLSTLGWPKQTKQLEKYFPWDFEISAPEIKFLWIARMIMIANYLTHKTPFKTMFFHGMLRDLQGRKFSKSLGNGIEPSYLIEKWGTDATRMTLYTYSIPGRDGRVSRKLLDERCKNFRNFATKIKNIARFTLDLKNHTPTPNTLQFKHKDDQWIKTELDKTIKNVTKNLETLNLHLAVDNLYEFVWHKFADIYIEKSKRRRGDSQKVLEHVLKNILILLHPFMPFKTEELYQKFENKHKSILLEKWPINITA